MPTNYIRPWGQLAHGVGTASDKWFLITDNEVAKIPYWLVLLMAGHRDPSSYYGPYIFYNNFESEPAAAYLRQMFKYRVLTPTAETKVRSLLQQYKPLVDIDEAFVNALIEREGCPDYWNKPRCSPQMIAEADCDGDPKCRRCFK